MYKKRSLTASKKPLIKHSRGFTLVELMLALAVLGILITVGIPSFNEFLNKQRLLVASTELVNAFQGARERAVTSGNQVNLQQQAKQVSCTYTDADGNAASCEHYQITDSDIQVVDASSNQPASANFSFSPAGKSSKGLNFLVRHQQIAKHHFAINIRRNGKIRLQQIPNS